MDSVAIVGMACRFSGEASTVEDFWEMVLKGETGHSKVPKNRYDAEAWHHPSHGRRGAVSMRPYDQLDGASSSEYYADTTS